MPPSNTRRKREARWRASWPLRPWPATPTARTTEAKRVTLRPCTPARAGVFPVVCLVAWRQGLFPQLRSLGGSSALEDGAAASATGITRAKEAACPLPPPAKAALGGMSRARGAVGFSRNCRRS